MQELFTYEGRKLYDDRERIPWDRHPRPLLKRDSFMNLCGYWGFKVRICGKEIPIAENRIRVPFPPESILSGVGRHFPEGAELVYKKTVSVPEGFRKDRLILHIDGADQHAEVYVEGSLRASHSGGYGHFSLDISDVPDLFTLMIVVRDDLTDHSEPYGKQRIKRGGMWYTPFSGIWQSVWIEAVPGDHVEKIHIKSDMDKARISTGNKAHRGSIRVTTPEGIETFKLNKGEAVIDPRIKKRWTPDDPYIYDFVLSLDSGDSISSYFALRKISIEKSGGVPRILLNGKPYFFNGLLDQGYYSDGLSTPADPSLYEADIRAVKTLGFNTLRKHVKVEPDLYYEACDRLGMVVFQDMVNNGKYSFLRETALPNIGFPNRDDTKTKVSEKVRSVFMERCRVAIKQLESFPSILYWTIFNEGWGQFDSVTVCKKLRKLLPDVIIDAASGWHDMGAGDVLSLHRYNEKFIFKPCDKPVILSEFGGFACRIKDHVYNPKKVYGYGIFKDPELLEKRVKELYNEEIIPVVSKGLCGCIYTQLSDVEDEINGIITYDRKVIKLKDRIEI